MPRMHARTHARHADTATLNGILAHIPNLSALTDGRDGSAKPALLLSLQRVHLRHFVSHESPSRLPPAGRPCQVSLISHRTEIQSGGVGGQINE